MTKINIALDFTRTPGARHRSDGPNSGEEFREKLLEPLFKEGEPKEKIQIFLDGTEGYGTSFLEEAFGGLARIYGKGVCKNSIEFVSTQYSLLIVEINTYIDESDK